MIYSSLQKQSGFTLVEMLVAVSLLLMVIVGPMAITAKASKSASFASEQVQAFFLAQEGLELAQSERDRLLLQNINNEGSYPNPWADFTNTTSGTFAKCYGSSGCSLVWSADGGDYNKKVIVGDCGSSGCKLYYNKNDVRSKFTYDSSGAEPTPFTRKIFFKSSGTAAVEVISTVTWRTGSILAEQKVLSETYLYNIYAKP